MSLAKVLVDAAGGNPADYLTIGNQWAEVHMEMVNEKRWKVYCQGQLLGSRPTAISAMNCALCELAGYAAT